MFLKELKSSGLSENEAKVYLAALELGETSVYRLAKKSGVKRTTTYLAVESLKEKGLMSGYNRNNVTICYAENPKKITDHLEKKKRSLDKIMPELLAFTNLIDKKPKIQTVSASKGALKNIGPPLDEAVIEQARQKEAEWKELAKKIEINKNRKYRKEKSPEGKDVFIRIKTPEDP